MSRSGGTASATRPALQGFHGAVDAVSFFDQELENVRHSGKIVSRRFAGLQQMGG